MPAEAIPYFTEDKACLFMENDNEVQAEEEVIIICDSLFITPSKKSMVKPYFSDPVGMIAREEL